MAGFAYIIHRDRGRDRHRHRHHCICTYAHAYSSLTLRSPLYSQPWRVLHFFWHQFFRANIYRKCKSKTFEIWLSLFTLFGPPPPLGGFCIIFAVLGRAFFCHPPPPLGGFRIFFATNFFFANIYKKCKSKTFEIWLSLFALFGPPPPPPSKA